MLVIVQFTETRPVPNATWPFIVNKVPAKGWSHKWWTPPSPFDYPYPPTENCCHGRKKGGWDLFWLKKFRLKSSCLIVEGFIKWRVAEGFGNFAILSRIFLLMFPLGFFKWYASINTISLCHSQLINSNMWSFLVHTKYIINYWRKITFEVCNKLVLIT